MGGFYNSIQVRTTDRAAVKATIESVAQSSNFRCLLGPEINGWVGVYPETQGQDDKVSRDIARQIDADVLHLMVHDDDVLAYWLYRNHALVDSYWSMPGYFGEENRADEEKCRGDVKQFEGIVGNHVKKLAALLDREADYTFESERLSALARLLGISNAVTAYDYLTSDEREGIKGWRQFETIPPDPVAQKTVEPRARKKSRKLIREKLTKSGDLLFHQEWKEFPQLASGFPIGEGFVLGWVNPWQRTAKLSQLMPPAYVAQPWQSDHDKFVAQTQGDLVVVDHGEFLRVFDKSFTPWKQLAELQNADKLRFSAISPNGKYIVYRNALKLNIRRIADGQRLCEIPRLRSGKIEFHPHGRWIAATGDQLGLICLDGKPSLREFFVGGKYRLIERLTPEIQETVRQRHAHNGFVLRALNSEKSVEIPQCVGFSRNGQLMWCGTDRGLHVYDWAALSRASAGTTKAKLWRFSYADIPERDPRQEVNVIAEEVDGTGIAFGGNAARITRLDLLTGKAQTLIDLPGEGSVESLLFSQDGKALAVHSCVTAKKGSRSMPNYTSSWEIWSYPKLIDRIQNS